MKEKIIEIVGFNMEPERAELIAQRVLDLFAVMRRFNFRIVKDVNRDKKHPGWEMINYGLEIDNEIVCWFAYEHPQMTLEEIKLQQNKRELYEEIVRRVNGA
jgi:hypothetical protein